MGLSWILCIILFIIVILLCFKIEIMRKSLKEISTEVRRYLEQDTNVLITVTSGDRYVKQLAMDINEQLVTLRKQRIQYINGDKELKEAVTNISHDLRTPLTAICGYLDLLEMEESNENVKRYVSMIKERSEVLKKLTEELFTYSIISSVPELEYETVNINKILEEVMVSFYGEMEEKSIDVTINIPEEIVSKRADKSALMRVFGNIISNAIKYSDGDFDVKMSTEGEIVFSNRAKNLDSVEVGKLFDRFYTVDSSRKSTGLGLAISKLLVERMGGKINAVYENERLFITVIL